MYEVSTMFYTDEITVNLTDGYVLYCGIVIGS